MGCWRDWSRKIFIRCEKGMSSLWCLFKTFIQEPPTPSLILLPLTVLLSDNVSWIISDQWSGIIFLHLSYNTPHPSAVLKYKLKRQESSKAFPYISVWFQTEIKERRARYAHVSRYPCLLKICMLQVTYFLVKMSVRNAKQIAFRWQCGFNGGC